MYSLFFCIILSPRFVPEFNASFFFFRRAHLAQCHNCGSSLTDQASDSAGGRGAEGEGEAPPPLTIPDVEEGVDKQAMVQDWLNPDTNAPLVQFHQDNLAIQKFSKVRKVL
jgi:hypothetical protein